MTDDPMSPERTWFHKFRDAFRGVKSGIRGQSSFFVHFFSTAAVIVAASVLRMEGYAWCILLLCIFSVLTAEMFNSALESMAKAVADRHDPHLSDSLDIASAAVLTASVGAIVVGTIVFGHRVAVLVGWT